MVEGRFLSAGRERLPASRAGGTEARGASSAPAWTLSELRVPRACCDALAVVELDSILPLVSDVRNRRPGGELQVPDCSQLPTGTAPKATRSDAVLLVLLYLICSGVAPREGTASSRGGGGGKSTTITLWSSGSL